MNKPLRILSIDGGGIRGILPAQILAALEKKLQQKSNNPDARLSDYFDLMAGTSTGGILVCLYLCPDSKQNLRPRFSAQEAIDLYVRNGKDIFHAGLKKKITSAGGLMDEKYSAENFEKLLQQYFGETYLSELLKPCIITSYNIFERTTNFFTQHDAKLREGYDYFLRDVARATSAAPSYFEPAKIYSKTKVSYPLIDGGIFANNPAMCAFAEARQLFKNKTSDKGIGVKDMFMVSIGTGQTKKPYEYEKATNWGGIGWIRPVLDMMMSGVSETVDYQLAQIFEAAEVSENYIRIEPSLGTASKEMDDVSEKNLMALNEAGIMSAERCEDELERIAGVVTTRVVITRGD